MSNELLFSINNLYCQYKSSTRPVLYIAELKIRKGEIAFFVGPSGIGKSTLLETLGLMNDTISNNQSGSISFHSEDREYDLKSLWHGNEKTLSEFRKAFFSFIFQHTNLFTTLSAVDNVKVVQQLKGASSKEAEERTRAIFSELELPKDLPKDYPVTSLSGGQRQRVAFARAVVSDYKVLFADEPTGNLDWFNAAKVMKVIESEIHPNDRTSELRSAVIVSHDTELALKFADTIIFIEKSLHEQMGQITGRSTFRKHNNVWRSELTTFSQEEMKEVMQNMYRSIEA